MAEQIEIIDGLGFNRETGEAFTITKTSQPEGKPLVYYTSTGLFFENTMQIQPVLGENLDASAQVVKISPWAFAASFTAESLAADIRQHTTAAISVTFASPNARFPVNVHQRQIQFDRDGKTARLNAGLIASGIARHGNRAVAIAEAIAEAERELVYNR